MLTKKQVLENNEDKKILINAVIKNVGMDNVENINNHGIDGGYSGFIYYSDTHKFAMRYRKYIVPMLEEQAEEFGEDVVKMVSGFGVFRSSPMDAEDKKDLYKYLLMTDFPMDPYRRTLRAVKYYKPYGLVCSRGSM